MTVDDNLAYYTNFLDIDSLKIETNENNNSYVIPKFLQCEPACSVCAMLHDFGYDEKTGLGLPGKKIRLTGYLQGRLCAVSI